MTRKRIFRLRPLAVQDVENIYLYSVQEFGSTQAEAYLRGLDNAFHKIAETPSLGSDYHHIRPGILAYRVISHVIFFTASADGVTIIRVLHKAMDYGQHV